MVWKSVMMYETPKEGFAYAFTLRFFEEDWGILKGQHSTMVFQYQHFSHKFPRHFIFANFQCLQCGQCCDHDRDVYTEDIERWVGEFRFDILEHVFCYGKNAFCAYVPEICEDCSKTGKVIVNRGDSIRCPFLRKVRNRPYYECTIHNTKPRDCAKWVCGKSLAIAHLNWNGIEGLIQRIDFNRLRTLWKEV